MDGASALLELDEIICFPSLSIIMPQTGMGLPYVAGQTWSVLTIMLWQGGPCWLCFEGEADSVILHCGHAGICFSCAERLWRRRQPCPMCRNAITLVAKVGDEMTIDGKRVVAPRMPTPKPG